MENHRKPDWDPRDQSVQRDQRAGYDDMRQRCPIAHSELLHWSLFRHQDVLEVILDHETFSNRVSTHLSVPNGMDPPEHTVFRRIIEPYFSHERMEAFEPICREIALTLIERFAVDEEIDLMVEFAPLFAVHVQCSFLGWLPDMHEPLRAWIRDNQEATLAQDRELLSAIAGQFESYVIAQLEARRGVGSDASDDVTSSLMREKVWDRNLTDAEIVSILRNWTAGEVGTIAASVGILAHFLATRPDVQQMLREDTGLLPPAIDEILRLDGPLVANRRVTTRPVEIGGRKLEAGERLSINWVSANRDENTFEDAHEFRLDRDPANNLLYGAGIHVCPGAPLARLEMRVLLEELLSNTSSIELNESKQAERAVYPAGGFSSVPLKIKWNKGVVT